MKKYVLICHIQSVLIFLFVFLGLYLNQASEVSIPVGPTASEYVGKVSLDTVSVRVLILKHAMEKMADDDANLAIDAVNISATKGLDIKQIGNHYINSEGQANRRLVSMMELKGFISEQMKASAESGDTLVVFTIGHGSPDGYLMSIGQRSFLMKAIADAAAENDQKTLWWQLSCYASAKLPPISSLPAEQQDLLSIVASSDSNTQSPAYVEGKIMSKVFTAIATKDNKLDVDGDEQITIRELAAFLESVDRGRGQLVYAKSPDEVVFGLSLLARRIPIFDPTDPNRVYPKDYVPIPKNKIPIPQ